MNIFQRSTRRTLVALLLSALLILGVTLGGCSFSKDENSAAGTSDLSDGVLVLQDKAGEGGETVGGKSNTPQENEGSSEPAAEDEDDVFIVNTSSRKMHTPDCGLAGRISPKNRKEIRATYEELLAKGYTPCSSCLKTPPTADADSAPPSDASSPEDDPTPDSPIPSPGETSESSDPSEPDFILNTSSKKIHLPSCAQANRISEKNRRETDKPLAQLLTEGYTPCKICLPDA